MKADRMNPLEVRENWTLNAIFPDSGGALYVWVDYRSGEIRFTSWDSIPEELRSVRPISAAYGGKYELPEGRRQPCSGVLNYGPAAGGLGEAGAFRILTCGEEIQALIPIHGFKNRRLGERIIGKTPEEALTLVERFTGQFSVSYASLFTLLAFEISEPCERYMHMALELERLHNHIWVMHKLASDASQKVASAHLAAMTEELLRLNRNVMGHRYGMGFLRLGPLKYERFAVDVKRIHREFLSLGDELLDSRIFVDRLHTTCTLGKEDVIENDISGIPARASGVLRDARSTGVMKAHYRDYTPPVESDGDSLARLLVRVEEALKSFEFLENTGIPACENHATPAKDGFHRGLIETPSGDAFMGLELKDGRVVEFMFRPASLPLYHAFSTGIRGNVFTDFPFALDSFGAYFADADSFGRWY